MTEDLPKKTREHSLTLGRRRLLFSGLVGLAATACATTRPTPSTSPGAELADSPSTLTSLAAPSEVPPAPVSTLQVAPPAATTATILCREAWGAKPARPGGRPHTITRMTLHHTAVVLGDNRYAPARLRQHQQYHQNEKGWIDIAYHVGVDRNGNIYELRTPELAGDTATEYDTTGHFLVLCEGDFDQEDVTEAQINSAAMAFAWAAQTFHVAPGTLAGHRDFAATSCPGKNLYAHVADGDLVQRLDSLLAGGAVDLQRICGPEAAARVAQIEAGG